MVGIQQLHRTGVKPTALHSKCVQEENSYSTDHNQPAEICTESQRGLRSVSS